ncbi:MAG: zinc ribbon domain-containing protein [Candidatus Bathyarchaeota archaeon]|nr:MAG: zinc ribbon domain-containing protein [Candidatus Bathyarchaeota archaeon]
MPYCPKCGAEVSEEMRFCTKCGATLGLLSPRELREKEEKHEKREKSEKVEKHEKGEYGYLGPLIGGLVLVVMGLMAYLHAISPTYARSWGAVLLIVVGVIIVVVAINAAKTAAKRSPKPP